MQTFHVSTRAYKLRAERYIFVKRVADFSR
jgi:hypothetical protein